MKSWSEFLKEVEMMGGFRDPRGEIEAMIAYLTHLRPPEIEDAKDKLLELQEVLEDKLTGA